MTNYERIKAMSIEEMAAFVEAAGRNNCQKICGYKCGSENCKKKITMSNWYKNIGLKVRVNR